MQISRKVGQSSVQINTSTRPGGGARAHPSPRVGHSRVLPGATVTSGVIAIAQQAGLPPYSWTC